MDKTIPTTRPAKRSPWAWVPTLYFAQGIPYIAVMTLSVIMYKRLGISNTDIALYTGWLYLPWVIKPFWSPFVDIFSTKRRWVLATQWLVALTFAGIAFTLPTPFFSVSHWPYSGLSPSYQRHMTLPQTVIICSHSHPTSNHSM